MAKSSFLPATDADFLVWHDNFNLNLAAQGIKYGLTAEDLAVVAADNADLHAKMASATQAAALAKQATADKAVSRGKADADARAIARRIKAHPEYAASVGMVLGIEGAEDTTDLSSAKPTLAAVDLGGGRVELSFNKSKSQGVNIYSQREGEARPIFLARDTASPYLDSRPLLIAGKPEMRRYSAVYVLNDAEIGLFSDELKVNCAP